MPIDEMLLEILACPASKVGVKLLLPEGVDRVNEAIRGGMLKTEDGRGVEDPLEEGLVTEDGKTVYRISSGIPIMLVEEGIVTDGVEVLAGLPEQARSARVEAREDPSS